MERKIIIITAPSGAGKTTIARRLLTLLPRLAFSISATTRPLRNGETDGVDYYFLSVQDFREKIAAQAFVEYETVYGGNYYGTLKAELDRIWKEGRYPLRVVDVTGALSLKEKFGPAALTIFIQPPSLEDLKKRLQQRGTESGPALLERLEKARAESAFARDADVVVVNDRLEEAVQACADHVRRFLE